MTDDPLASSPASNPSGRKRRAVGSRPDLRLCLLEAIQQRDASQTRFLGQRWVHRHGLVTLEAFQRITLRSLEGDEGCRWLQEQLGLEPPPASAADALAFSLARLEVSPANEPLTSVETAFAALAAEFPDSESATPAEPAVEEPLAPLPSFHPTASILAALAEPVAPASSPPGPSRWLPRLRFPAPAPAHRPAPPPADLADLRAWLPDAVDDLPRAC